MKIELHEITVREIVAGYLDRDEEGVTGYGGKLNIRPEYQREFIYDEKKRNAVIDTIQKGFPLNYISFCGISHPIYVGLPAVRTMMFFVKYRLLVS